MFKTLPENEKDAHLPPKSNANNTVLGREVAVIVDKKTNTITRTTRTFHEIEGQVQAYLTTTVSEYRNSD